MDLSSKNKINQSRFHGFSAEKKLKLALQLYWDARKLKTAAVKSFHPEMSDQEVEKKVRDIFLYARS